MVDYMNISIKCSSPELVYCPKCGAIDVILAKSQCSAHCGHCGLIMGVTITEKVKTAKEKESLEERTAETLSTEKENKTLNFSQLSIFDL